VFSPPRNKREHGVVIDRRGWVGEIDIGPLIAQTSAVIAVRILPASSSTQAAVRFDHVTSGS
jgi:hypothetical protein